MSIRSMKNIALSKLTKKELISKVEELLNEIEDLQDDMNWNYTHNDDVSDNTEEMYRVGKIRELSKTVDLVPSRKEEMERLIEELKEGV